MNESFHGLNKSKEELNLISKFKKNLIKQNKSVQEQIESSPPKYLKEIANILLKYINGYEGLKNLEFFFRDPNINKEQLEKYIKNSSIQHEFILKTLKFFTEYIDKHKRRIEEGEISKKCSEYLYENRKNLENKEVFKLLKYFLTGCQSNLLLSEICEVLQREQILERLQKVQNLLNK